MQALGAVLEAHPHIMVLSDEIYEHILFDGRQYVSFAAACPQLRERTLTVNGVSKAYAMTGWRVGYAGGPRDIITAMNTLQSQSCTSVCTVAQHATVAALNGPQGDVKRFCAAFENRRNLVVDAVKHIDGLTLAAPDGAFYAYIGCADYMGRRTPACEIIADDAAFAHYLLHHAHVATVPGAAYGLSPFFRISTATSEDILTEALRRIGAAVGRLQ